MSKEKCEHFCECECHDPESDMMHFMECCGWCEICEFNIPFGKLNSHKIKCHEPVAVKDSQ